MSVEKILKYKKKIEKSQSVYPDEKLIPYLRKLESIKMSQSLLEKTKVGITINSLRSRNGKIGEMAKRIVHSWSEMVKRNLSVVKNELPPPVKETERNTKDVKVEKPENGVSEPPQRSEVRQNGRNQSVSPPPMVKDEESVDGQSGLSFEDLLSSNDSGTSKKRKRRSHGKDTATFDKKPRMSKATDAAIRESLSRPDVDYATEFSGNNKVLTKLADEVSAKARKEEQEREEEAYAPLKLNSRSQVYSGRAKSVGVMTLQEACLNVFYKNVDYIGHMSERAAFHILEPFLERLTAAQLERIERWNPHLIGDDDKLWKKHCQRDFKTHNEVQSKEAPFGLTWRKCYFRLRKSKDKKLDSLTRVISANKEKVNQGERKAKIAFEWVAPKAPREVRRQQAKFGTNRTDAIELASPSKKVEGEQRKFIKPQAQPEVYRQQPKKKSSHLKKLISSIKRTQNRR